MHSAALAIKSVDTLVKVENPFTFDPDDEAETAIAANLLCVKADRLVPGNVIVYLEFFDVALPLDMSVRNLKPPQAYFVVLVVGNNSILVELILYLYDGGANPQPAALGQYTLIGPTTNGPVANRAPGSRHRFASGSGNVYMVTPIGLFLSGQALSSQRVLALCPNGLVGVPAQGPNVTAPVGGNQLVTNPAASLPPATAPVPHETSAALARRAALLPLVRLLTRNPAPLPPGALTPTEFVDSLVGPGKINDVFAHMSVSAIVGDPANGIVTTGRLAFACPENTALLMGFGFSTIEPMVSPTPKGVVISSLVLDVFAEAKPDGSLARPASIKDQYDRMRELKKTYESLLKGALPAGDSSLDLLFAPILQSLAADGKGTLVLREPFIDQRLVSRELNRLLFSVRLLANDPRKNLPAYAWDLFVADVHEVWRSFDIQQIREQSIASRLGVGSMFGLQLSASAVQGGVVPTPPAAAADGGRPKKRARGARGAGTAPAAAQPTLQPPAQVSTAGTLACSYFLAHRLGVLDMAGVLIRDCNRPGCKFEHRVKPVQPLSAAEKQKWLREYGNGSLPFKAALAAAITALP